MRIGRIGIQPRAVLFPAPREHFAHAAMAEFPGMQFVSKGEHDERRMIGEHIQGSVQFIPIEGILFIVLKRVSRIPAGQFRLHEHAQRIGSLKRRFRRHMRMEAHAVDAVASVGSQHTVPVSRCHRLIPCFREHSAVGFCAQMNDSAVEGKVSVPRTEIPDAKPDRDRIQSIGCGRHDKAGAVH